MTSPAPASRPWYFWPLIAFVAGLLIGWIVIGWGLWPVTWTNALPSDLKAELQYNYLTMVAESYAANGDAALAQQRVASWDPDQLAKTLADLQEYLADTQPQRVAQVQALTAVVAPQGTQGAAAAPTPATNPPTTAQRSSLGTLCTSILWAALVIGGIAFLAWLFLRWRKAEGRQLPSLDRIMPRKKAPASADEVIEREKQVDIGLPPATVAAATTVPLKTPPPSSARVVEGELEQDVLPPVGRPVYSASDDLRYAPPAVPVEPAAAPPPEVSKPLPESVEPEPRPARPSTPAGPTPLPKKIAEFMAVFPDETREVYDDVFDLKDPSLGPTDQEGYLGQCGVTVRYPDGVSRGPEYALQLWLNDRRDSDYQIKVLMSEGAYRDTSLRAEYAGKHTVQPLRPGTEVEMTTRNLMLRARAELVDYDESREPLHGVLARVHLRLIVYKRPV